VPVDDGGRLARSLERLEQQHRSSHFSLSGAPVDAAF